MTIRRLGENSRSRPRYKRAAISVIDAPARSQSPGPAALLGLEPGEVMLAAAHPADLAAARGVGLATAFIARPLEHGPAAEAVTATAGWDLTGASITEIASRL